jgi:peptidoglycan-N-acetylglucosamine deacetylase
VIRFYSTPEWIHKLLPSYTWHRRGTEKTLYLTFDDGPIPVVTPFVLEQLAKYKAKATFFCVGENLEKHKAIAVQAVKEGHVLANHTYNHLKGWQTAQEVYLQNIALCEKKLAELSLPEHTGKKLFRPPYGRISRGQTAALQTQFDIIMWDVLTNDYDTTLSPEKCLKKAIKHTREGSIIVFHDSLKAQRNLMYTLPRFLEHFTAQGYTFKAL